MTTYTEEQMIAIGGSRWQRAGTDEVRVYLNDWEELVGITADHYRTGNICYCDWTHEVDGETVTEVISNSKAREFGPVKVYWKSTDGRVYSSLRAVGDRIRVDGGGDALIAALHAGIRAKLAHVAASR